VNRFPDYGVSVAVLCNAGKLDQGEYAGRIFDVLVPHAPKKRARARVHRRPYRMEWT